MWNDVAEYCTKVCPALKFPLRPSCLDKNNSEVRLTNLSFLLYWIFFFFGALFSFFEKEEKLVLIEVTDGSTRSCFEENGLCFLACICLRIFWSCQLLVQASLPLPSLRSHSPN